MLPCVQLVVQSGKSADAKATNVEQSYTKTATTIGRKMSKMNPGKRANADVF
jgi:predicted transcriptional regulator